MKRKKEQEDFKFEDLLDNVLKDFTYSDQKITLLKKRVKLLIKNWATMPNSYESGFGKHTPESLALATYVLGMVDATSIITEINSVN